MPTPNRIRRVTVGDLIKRCADHNVHVDDAVVLVEAGDFPVPPNEVDHVMGRDDQGDRFEGFSLVVYSDDLGD